MLYACDGRWWDHHIGAVRAGFRGGMLWTQDRKAAKAYGLRYVPAGNDLSLSLNPLRINTGGNSGFQALNIAINAGASRVVLLGFDMQPGPNGEPHWHGSHEKGLNNPGQVQFAHWRQAFNSAARQLRNMAVEVINCSRRTALEAFPRGRLEDVL